MTMADILHEFPIRAPAEKVYGAITSPSGLDAWWTLRSSGEPVEGSVYELCFGPEYDWRAVVLECSFQRRIAWRFVEADPDWLDTVVRITLEESGTFTNVQFSHAGWSESNDHFRTSSYCWAMYLRLLKRFVETGEAVPYEERLEA